MSNLIPYINSYTSYPGIYSNGDNIDIKLNFTQNMFVNTDNDLSGNYYPRLNILVGNKDRIAKYYSGDGTSSIGFRYTVQADDAAKNGVKVKDVSAIDASGINQIGTALDIFGEGAELGSIISQFGVVPNFDLQRAGFTLSAGGVIVEGAPVFSSTPSTSIAEDSLYSYNVEANDYDTDDIYDASGVLINTSANLSGTTIPDWLSFNISENTGTLSGTPDNSDLGSHDVLITATDLSGNTNTQEFSILVANVNDPPVFNSTNITDSTEGTFYYYKLTVEDIDPTGDSIDLSATVLPSWLSFDENTGVLSGTPYVSNLGDHNVSIKATDSRGASTVNSFIITVLDPPIFLNTPILTATEERNYSYKVEFGDNDIGDTVTLSGDIIPSWASFNASTAVLSGTPGNNDALKYHFVRIVATDSYGLSSNLNFSIFVINTNDPPSFTSTPIITATEDVLYSYTITTTDSDPQDFVTLYTCGCTTLPSWLNFNKDTGVLSGIPRNSNVGVHQVTIRAQDTDCYVISQEFNITVANVNDPPTFTSTPVTTALEDSVYSYTVTAADLDPTSDTFDLSGTTIPSWLTFNASTGLLTGTPLNEHVGSNSVIITATDSNNESSTQEFSISVANTNDDPVFTSTPITNATEDTEYTYTITVTDPDPTNDTITLTATTIPLWLNLNSNTRILSGTPLVTDVGTHSIVISAADGNNGVSNHSFSITVADFNDSPVFTSTPITTATEDISYSYIVTASDEEGDIITLSGTTIPSWLNFQASSGTLNGTPSNNDVGDHNVVITASSPGSTSVTQSFSIKVINVNDAPTITSTSIISINEDSLYSYTLTASDVDAGDVLTLSATTIPSWLTFNASTGVLSGTPLNEDVGEHSVTLVATDLSGATDIQNFKVTVVNVNDPPEFTSTPITTATEDLLYSYTITATDPDPTSDTITFSAPTIPSWLSLNVSTGVLSGTPLNNDVDDFNITLTATDSNGSSVNQSFTIKVFNTNDAPIFTSTPISNATQDIFYSYTITTNDVDVGDTVTLNGTTIPSWLSFNATSGLLSGTPTNSDVGTHSVVISATDLSDAVVNQSFSITVANVNDPPEFTSNPITTATEDVLYSYSILTNDIDVGDSLTVTATTIPSWLNLSGSTLSGTPTNTNVGTHSVVLKVTDIGGLSASQSFNVSVTNVNDAPVITSNAITTINEDTLYSYTIVVNDVDVGDNISLTATTIPSWLSFNTSTGVLSGTPTNNDVGNHSVSITATDGIGATDIQSFNINVVNVNDLPVFTSTSITTATEDTLYSYTVLATDVDSIHGDSITLSVTTKPSWLSFNSSTSLLSGTPLNADVGTHNVVIKATDSTNSYSSQNFSIIVENINDAPVFTSTPITVVNEDSVYSYTITTNDIDIGDAITLSSTQLPTWLSLNTSTGVLSGTPDNSDVGNHDIIITASDLSGASVNHNFTITVNNINDPPVFTSTPITSILEDSFYSYTLTTSDPDPTSDTVTLSVVTKPAWLNFGVCDNCNVKLTGTPLNTDVGNHTVTIKASDSNGASTNQTFNVAVINVNDAPFFTSTPILTATEDINYSYILTANDVDVSDSLTFTVPTKPSWLSFDSNNKISGIPANNDVGIHNVVATVTDGIISINQSFTVTVINTNDAPTITSTQITSVLEDTLYEYTVIASDIDVDDIITLKATTIPSWLSFNSTTGLLSGTPSNNEVGNYSIVIEATDKIGATAIQSFTVTVVNVNDVPEITSTPITKITERKLYEYTVTTNDIDPTSDRIDLSGITIPYWASFTTSTGILKGTPPDSGNFSVVIRATDEHGLFVTQEFTITVEEMPTHYLPQLCSISQDRANDKLKIKIPASQINDFKTYGLGNYNIEKYNTTISFKFYILTKNDPQLTVVDSNNSIKDLSNIDLSNNITGTNGLNVSTNNVDGILVDYDVITVLPNNVNGSKPIPSYPSFNTNGDLEVSFPENQTLDQKYGEGSIKFKTIYAFWTYDISNSITTTFANTSSNNSDYGIVPRTLTYHDSNFLFNNYNFYPSLKGGTVTNSIYQQANVNSLEMDIAYYLPGKLTMQLNSQTGKIDLIIPKSQLDDLSRNSMLDEGFYNITSTNKGAIGCKIYLWYQTGKNYTINPNRLKYTDLSSNTNTEFPYDVVIDLKPKNNGSYPASFPNGYPEGDIKTSWPENVSLEKFFGGPRIQWGGYKNPFYALWVWDISSQYLGGKDSMSSITTPPNPTFHYNNFLPGDKIKQVTNFYGNANIQTLRLECPPFDAYCDNPRGRGGRKRTLLVTKTKNYSNFKMRYASAVKNKRAANSFMC